MMRSVLLRESGVTHMGFGTESTSEAVLKLMNKRHQRMDEVYETARKANLAGIRVTFNLIFGYPGETEDDRLRNVPHDERNRPRIPQCQFLAKCLHSLSGDPNLAATAGVGGARAAVAAGMGGTAAGNECIALAARTGTGAAAAHAGLLPAEQSYAKKPSKASSISRVVQRVVKKPVRWRIRVQQIFISMGALVSQRDRTVGRSAVRS